MGASPALEVFVSYLALEVLSMQFRVVGVLRKRDLPMQVPCEGEADRLHISRQPRLETCLDFVMGELCSYINEDDLTGEERKYIEIHLLLEAVRYTTLNQLNILDSTPIESDGPYKEGL